MKLRFMSVTTFGVGEAAELLTRGFADYFVKIAFTETALKHMERMDSVDFSESRVVVLDDAPVGVALIARRGCESRLAGMAVLPDSRRRGVARELVRLLVADARARGDRRMVLEVIEQNTPAVRLYESVGFQAKRRLVGFLGTPPAGLVASPDLAQVSLRDVADAVSRLDAEVEWPWQISGVTIAQLAQPSRGYSLDGAWAALLNPSGPVVQVRGLAVEGPDRRDERAANLLRAMMSRHPAHEWRMSAVWPEELASRFTAAGFARQELTQWQMALNLAAEATIAE
jgi:ribosomal protein S18 acetylase RimI-like enzyme